MSSEWIETRLGELCTINNGKSDTQDAVLDGPYVFFDRSRVPKRSSRFLFDCEALIVPGEGTEFLPRHFSGKFDLHQRAYALHEFSSKADARLLFYWLHHRSDYLPSVAVGATVKSLRMRHFEQFPVRLPTTRVEQRRIVAILDEAFAGIATAKANAERNVTNAGSLFEARLDEAMSGTAEWPEKKFDEICAIESTLVDPRKHEFLDLPHVGAGNIEAKTGRLLELQTAREEKLISGKFTFDPSMVLYSKIRPYLMKVARPSFEGLCSADMYPLTPNEGCVCRDYLFYILLTKRFTDYAIAGSSRAGMPKVNREHLFEYRTRVPPLREQKKIAASLDEARNEITSLENVYTRKLAALDDLKKSLLHHAFAGEL